MIYQVDTHDGTSTDLVSQLLGLLGVQALIGELVGINCSPITVIGLGGTKCTQETLCCTGNSYVSIEYLSCPLLLGLMMLLSPPRRMASSPWAAPRLTSFFKAFLLLKSHFG